MSISPALNLIKTHFGKKPLRIIEIGARYGESSELLIKTFNIDKYVIIDPYTSYDEYQSDGFNAIIKDNDDKIFNETKQRLERLTKNVIFIREFSNNKDIINIIDDESFDLIFIDGNHTYKYVLEDLINYYPKIKKGGLVIGDDFFMRHKDNDILKTLFKNDIPDYNEPMVYEAVIEFCNKNNLSHIELGKHADYGKLFVIAK